MKPSPSKPSTRTGASTRASMQKAKEQAKERAIKIEQKGPPKKRLRRKYVATPESDEEIEDTSQFRVVSHPLKYKVDIICDNIKDSVDMSKLRDINFDKLSKDE